MSQKLVTLRQMQNGVGLITALSLGIAVSGMADGLNDAPPIVPPEVQMTELGAKAYDLALTSNWKEANQVVAAIEAIGTRLPPNEDGTGLRNRFGLFRAMSHLKSAIASRHKWEAAWASNRITLFASRLVRSFPRKAPFELILLDVYGRDLQVASARNDEVTAHKAIGSLHLNWRKLRPRVLNVGADNINANAPALSRHFDNLLQRAGAAPDTKNMGDQATLILAEVSNVKQLFARGTKPVSRPTSQ